MLNFCDGTRLEKHFGDFGGNDDMSDFEVGRLNPNIAAIRETIESARFEEAFLELRSSVCGDFSIKVFRLDNGCTLFVAPALGKRTALAARFAHAICLGKKAVAFGSGDKELIGLAVRTAMQRGLDIRIILSRALAKEEGYADSLRAQGATVDSKTAVEAFDTPYSYLEPFFVHDPEAYVLQSEANYGAWPRPALTGVFAGLYGADLLKKLGKTPEACVVPIESGTEAIGVFKALKHTGCRLATCEATVAQEYHMIDTCAYTLATRSADEDKAPTSICPELADMWRKNTVLRLGCDRIYPVDATALDATGLSEATKRAAVLAFEVMACKELLVLEV